MRRGSAALDTARVLQHATVAVLCLGQQTGAALLDGEVPDAGREFGDRHGRAVLRVQGTRYRHGEPERREGPCRSLLRLPAERLPLLRPAAVRLLLGARVAVTALWLPAVGLGRGRPGGREESSLQG